MLDIVSDDDKKTIIYGIAIPKQKTDDVIDLLNKMKSRWIKEELYYNPKLLTKLKEGRTNA